MALSSIGVPRTTSVFKASCLDVNGSNWALQNSCSLPPSDSASTTYSIGGLQTITPRRSCVVCSAVQESSTPTVSAEKKEAKTVKKEAGAAPAPASKPKPAAKAPVKPLPQMMEEDIIPSLRSTLEAQEDISELELSFLDDRLEGSFVKNGYPYTFWAFFPTGLTGPKGFSLSAYGNGASTVEPFLIDEKKITAKHVVFWVEKRLAAQGIIPVWSDE